MRVPLLSVLLFLFTHLIAGTTGKINGFITDRETGEKLIGVNVFIQESYLGAACDSFYFTASQTGNYRVMAAIFDSTDIVINDPDYLVVDAVEWLVTVIPSTSITAEELESNPYHFALYPNYPNPFNAATRIEYQLPVPSQITLTVYDVSGHPVKQLCNEWQLAGLHTFWWDGTSENGWSLASGIYFYVLRIGDDYQFVRKMTLLK